MTTFFLSFDQNTGKTGLPRRQFVFLRKAAALVAISGALSGSAWSGGTFDRTTWGAEATANATITEQASQEISVWQPSVEEACVRAEKEDKLLLLHFWTADSEECRAMERNFYGDADVVQQLSKDYLCIPVNGTKNAELLRELGLTANFPTDLVLTTDAEVLFSRVGTVESSQYLTELQQTAERYRQRRQNGMNETSAASIATPDITATTSDTDLSVGSVSTDANNSATTSTDAIVETVQKPTMESFDFDSMLTVPSMDVGNTADAGNTADVVESATVENDDGIAPPESLTVAANGTAAVDGVNGVDGANTPLMSEPFTAEEKAILEAAPPLALDGYSPVAVATDGVWSRGDVRYGVIHRGRTWLFTSEAEVKLFLDDPDRYAPVLTGYDVVAAVDQRQLTPGLREIAAESEGQIFLFVSEENYEKFCQDPEKYTQAAKRIVQESEMRAARAARHLGTSLFR